MFTTPGTDAASARKIVTHGLTLVLLAAAAIGGRDANAQLVPLPLTSYLYSADFICGSAEPTRDVQTTGNAAFSPYDDFEPGHYATSLTVHNTAAISRGVTFFVTAPGLPANLQIETLTIGPLETRRFGCLNFMDEIQANFPTILFGQLIQGTVYFTQVSDDIELTRTQTYSAVGGDAGSGGVSIDVSARPPRELDGLRIITLP